MPLRPAEGLDRRGEEGRGVEGLHGGADSDEIDVVRRRELGSE